MKSEDVSLVLNAFIKSRRKHRYTLAIYTIITLLFFSLFAYFSMQKILYLDSENKLLEKKKLNTDTVTVNVKEIKFDSLYFYKVKEKYIVDYKKIDDLFIKIQRDSQEYSIISNILNERIDNLKGQLGSLKFSQIDCEMQGRKLAIQRDSLIKDLIKLEIENDRQRMKIYILQDSLNRRRTLWNWLFPKKRMVF